MSHWCLAMVEFSVSQLVMRGKEKGVACQSRQSCEACSKAKPQRLEYGQGAARP
jgi:hypothetical protein